MSSSTSSRKDKSLGSSASLGSFLETAITRSLAFFIPRSYIRARKAAVRTFPPSAG